MCSSKPSIQGAWRSRRVVDSTVHSLPLTRTPNPTDGALIASWSAKSYVGHAGMGNARTASARFWPPTRGEVSPAAGAARRGCPDTVLLSHLDGISRVGVVGLGTIGSQELALWQRSGPQTVGYDVSESRVKSLGSHAGSRLSTRIADLNACDVLVL